LTTAPTSRINSTSTQPPRTIATAAAPTAHGAMGFGALAAMGLAAAYLL
jgi:hypothetical protein